MKPCLFFAGVLLLFAIAGPAQAQVETMFDQGAELDSLCPDGLCFGAESGPTVSACHAQESFGQKCASCGYATDAYGNPTDKPACVGVEYSAWCKCNLEPVPGAGPNIVECKKEGSCTYYYR